MSLKGKTVFITGGTGGIGRPLVQLLRQNGAIVTVYDQKQEGDLAAQRDSVCRRLRDDTPDILINMAGFNAFDYCENQDLEAIITLNMIVPLRLSQAVLPGMKKRGTGQIINIGSMTALIPLPHLTGYVAAKAGLKGFSDALRRELADTGITITHIVPRAVRTAMNTGTRAEINDRTGVTYDAPEKIAARIFTAIERGEHEVRIGGPERLFAFINALCPGLIDRGLRKNRLIGEDILSHPPRK